MAFGLRRQSRGAAPAARCRLHRCATARRPVRDVPARRHRADADQKGFTQYNPYVLYHHALIRHSLAVGLDYRSRALRFGMSFAQRARSACQLAARYFPISSSTCRCTPPICRCSATIPTSSGSDCGTIGSGWRSKLAHADRWLGVVMYFSAARAHVCAKLCFWRPSCC